MKLLKKIREWLEWIFNPRIIDAINGGATYEEVDKIARGEIKENRCVSCGSIIPEGRQVCPNCENKYE